MEWILDKQMEWELISKDLFRFKVQTESVVQRFRRHFCIKMRLKDWGTYHGILTVTSSIGNSCRTLGASFHIIISVILAHCAYPSNWIAQVLLIKVLRKLVLLNVNLRNFSQIQILPCLLNTWILQINNNYCIFLNVFELYCKFFILIKFCLVFMV